MRIPPRGPRRRIPRWQRGNWKAEKRGKLICRASRGSRGVETGGKEEGGGGGGGGEEGRGHG